MTIRAGDYVRPDGTASFFKGMNPDAVFRVQWVDYQDQLELQPENEKAERYNLRGVRLPASDFVKVVLVRGRWRDVKSLSSTEMRLLAQEAVYVDTTKLEDLFPGRVAVLTGRMSASAPAIPNIPKPGHGGAVGTSVEDADKIVERAEETLKLARENAKAKRKQEAEAQRQRAAAAKKAEAVREALARQAAVEARLDAEVSLARATIDLLHELRRKHQGGEDQPAHPAIAKHADQLDPLARTYGYKIAKAGTVTVVTKA